MFTCGSANRYPGKYVHGLTLTARCDIAQKKYRLLNYVPVVELADWLLMDGAEILILDEQKDLQGRKENILREANLSISLLTSVSLAQIASVHFEPVASDKKGRDRLKKILALVDFDNEFSTSLENGAEATLGWFRRHRSNKIADLIRRLSRQDVTGFYFLERLQAGEPPKGYVCLLREINTIPQHIAERLSTGISKAEWNERHASVSKTCLSFDKEDFGMPISQIGSPTIEHIMQCFSNLFSRIGLPDPVEAEISNIISAHAVTLETT